MKNLLVVRTPNGTLSFPLQTHDYMFDHERLRVMEYVDDTKNTIKKRTIFSHAYWQTVTVE